MNNRKASVLILVLPDGMMDRLGLQPCQVKEYTDAEKDSGRKQHVILSIYDLLGINGSLSILIYLCDPTVS